MAPDPPQLQGKAGLEGLALDGRKGVRKWGCFNCHEIKSFEHMHRLGPPLDDFGSRTAEDLDFGDAILDPEKRTWLNWVDLKLRQPHAYVNEREGARMPQFNLSELEVEALLVFLKSQTGKSTIPEKYLADRAGARASAARGDFLVDYLGCRNCHAVEGRGGRILDEYPEGSEGVALASTRLFAPPTLVGEGQRVRPSWLYEYLVEPKVIRPWMRARMPTFRLAGILATPGAVSGVEPRDSAADLAEYFATASGATYPFVARPTVSGSKATRQTARLFLRLGCATCHSACAKLGSLTVPAPDLANAPDRLRAGWVANWLADPQRVIPGTAMPALFRNDTPSAGSKIEATATLVVSGRAPTGSASCIPYPRRTSGSTDSSLGE
jgi:cytochrome c2